jgi:2-polyprenyl-3-methyl-5-hydroxy-6-metoxy-1,4-benzoquinol methylase
MPSSRYEIIPFVLKKTIEFKPKSILDIGVGFGKYGVLFREYLDVWNVEEDYKHNDIRIDGVEIFKEYENPVWKVYNKVHIGDIRKLSKKLPEYDLVFMGDVIEHFTKMEGITILNELRYKHIIIVTPIEVSAQKAVYNNPYETHKSQWTYTDFPMPMMNYSLQNINVFYR